MPRCTVLLGDQLPALASLSHHDDVVTRAPDDHLELPPRSARAVVIGLDLRATTSLREASRTLKRSLRSIDSLRRYGALIHLCIVYVAPPGIPSARLRSVAGGVASRLHAKFERETGMYVDVALLDVSDCDDNRLLAERITEQIALSAGAYTDIALTWPDMFDRSITQATIDRYA